MGFWKRVGQLAVVLGPTTVLTGFLFYVGHVSTKAFYSYFGVSVSALDIPSSTILLRSIDDLFDPMITIVWVAIAAFVLHHIFVAAVERQQSATISRLAALFACVAMGLAAFGIAGLAGISRSRFTPWALGLSGIAIEYACWLTIRVTRKTSALGALVRAGVNLRRGLIAALVLLAVFWAATAVANARGTARAKAVESSLAIQSQAVVYSRTDLRITGPGIGLTRLPGTDEDFRYRYNGLRPLVHNNGAWLLLPVGWTKANGSTVVVLADMPGVVRVDLAR